MPASGIGPRPCPPARLLLWLTVPAIPMVFRDRYREEFGAELADLRPPAQVFHAGSLLVGSVSLRRALSQVNVIEDLTVQRSRRCRLGRHHYFGVADDNPEVRGRLFLKCERCGRTKDFVKDPPLPPKTVVLGAL
jgi:hypothetical protein